MLVAISIPIFTKQLEKSREATDEANLRSVYSEAVAACLAEDTTATSSIKGATLSVVKDDTTKEVTATATYTCTQLKDGLESGDASVNVGGAEIAASEFGKGKTFTIVAKNNGDVPTINGKKANGTE